MPTLQSLFITLLELLYIKVWLRFVDLVGEVLLGGTLAECMMSRKSKTFLFELHVRRSISKSLSAITSLFSLIDFSERNFEHPSTSRVECNAWISIHPSC